MTSAPIPGLTRHFVTLGNRQVHYRRMGRGPALLALHRLPRSSRDLVPFLKSASERFTVIAPDFAGYGGSWQLAKSVGTTTAAPVQTLDYVEDVEALLDELGIKRCAIYGEQVGAAVCVSATRSASRRRHLTTSRSRCRTRIAPRRAALFPPSSPSGTVRTSPGCGPSCVKRTRSSRGGRDGSTRA
jgi:pimeloyl-ACP methyl ester carboxylesterase